MIPAPAADITGRVKPPLTGNYRPTALALVKPARLLLAAGLAGRRRIPGPAHLGQEPFEGRTAVAVVLPSQVQVVVAQFVENDLLQVFLIKFRVHQRVNVDMVVNEVVAAPCRLQAAVKDDLVQKRPLKVFQRPFLCQLLKLLIIHY